MDSLSTITLDIDIEDARTKKKTIDAQMASVMSFMREVELKEKDAANAKQEVDDCSLDILAEIDELVVVQQHAKETNDKRAREVYEQKVDLDTEMNELQFRVSGVLDEGDGCLVTIDEMYKSLEKRLTLAIMKKEAAEKEKLQKETALAYEKFKMEKLVEEFEKLEQQAIENSKLQEFLMDRRHVVNMLKEDISCKCLDVNLLKEELEDHKDVTGLSVTEDFFSPIMQDMIWRQDNECYNSILKGVKGGVVGSREEMKRKKMCKSWINSSKKKEMKKWISGEIREAVADHEEVSFE